MLVRTRKDSVFTVASLPVLALLVTGTLWAVFSANSFHAQVRLKFPEQTPGGPVYARVERPFLIHTDEWSEWDE